MEMVEEHDIDMLANLLDDDDDEDIDGPTLIIDETLSEKDESFSTKQTVVQPCENKASPNESLKSTSRILKDIDVFSNQSSNIQEKISDKSKDAVRKSVVHSGETDSSDDERQSTESARMIKRRLATKESYVLKAPQRTVKTWKDFENKGAPGSSSKSIAEKNAYLLDNSGIRIINPLFSRDMMKNRTNGRQLIKMSFIRRFMKNGDIQGDWYTIGVLIHKSHPKTSINNKTYSIWRMTDLIDVDKPVSIFLFGAVHAELWKTAIGTVLGILNPSFFSDQKNSSKDLSLRVDHAGKFMVMGTSKDFGQCRGKRRDGEPCTSVVNKSECDFCPYHVAKEYKKLSAKRTDLQSSYSGRQPSLKDRLLKGQNVMYGGQMFSTPPVPKGTTKQKTMKDQLTLQNLGLKRKANALEAEERMTKAPKITGGPLSASSKTTPAQSEFITQQLAIPSAGSRNLSQHLTCKDTAKVESADRKNMISVTPKELLKMHARQLQERKQMQQKPVMGGTSSNGAPQRLQLAKAEVSEPFKEKAQMVNKPPQLGRGVRPGDEVCFDLKPIFAKNSVSPQVLAKLKAIKTVQQKGPIEQKNPNAVKSRKSSELAAKIMCNVEKSSTEVDKVEQEKRGIQNRSGVLGTVDEEKLQRILNRKSSHAFEIEVEEFEKQEAYFSALEKKEKMEEKMATITEMVCNVVSCKTCRYTAHQATDRCKSENHPLKCHRAVKKFFKCKRCSSRTCSFSKFPTRPCRNCGESSFERTSMLKPRNGPKLENEILNIRGDEVKFLNSLKS